MTDLEEQLREALTASVADAQPSFTIRDVRRRHRRGLLRVTATAVAAAAVIVAAVLAGTGYGGGSRPPTSAVVALKGVAVRYADPRFGWTIHYPKGMVLGYFHSAGMTVSDGIRLTNFAPDLDAPSTGTPAMGWLRDFPAGGVALQIWFGERNPGLPPLRDSSFPLTRISFHRNQPYVGGNEPSPLYRTFYADGFAFSAAAWLGPHASGADQRALWSAVASLRFPALAPGTIWQDSYYVLGQSSHYPRGSVTLVPASSLPRGGPSFPRPEGFYLIHAPRQFYVVDKSFQNPVTPSVTCTVVFDPQNSQFSCPGLNLQWDRVGQPLGRHAGDGPDWALPLHIVTVAQDQHILFSPLFGGVPVAGLGGNPWG